jgi:hypothetical protein
VKNVVFKDLKTKVGVGNVDITNKLLEHDASSSNKDKPLEVLG